MHQNHRSASKLKLFIETTKMHWNYRNRNNNNALKQRQCINTNNGLEQQQQCMETKTIHQNNNNAPIQTMRWKQQQCIKPTKTHQNNKNASKQQNALKLQKRHNYRNERITKMNWDNSWHHGYKMCWIYIHKPK